MQASEISEREQTRLMREEAAMAAGTSMCLRGF